MNTNQRPQDTTWWRWFVAPLIVGGAFALLHVPIALPFVIAGLVFLSKRRKRRKPSKQTHWQDGTWMDPKRTPWS